VHGQTRAGPCLCSIPLRRPSPPGPSSGKCVSPPSSTSVGMGLVDSLSPRHQTHTGRFRYIAWVKHPYRDCGQSVSALCGRTGTRLSAHTELRTRRQRSAREAIYRNRPIEPSSLESQADSMREVARCGSSCPCGQVLGCFRV